MAQVIHYFFHLIFPAFIAFWFYKKEWRKTYLLFLLTMAVDVDHLFALPIFDPCRCSINFHPLHSFPEIGVYFILLLFPKSRIISIGLLLHMATDGLDCFLQNCR